MDLEAPREAEAGEQIPGRPGELHALGQHWTLEGEPASSDDLRFPRQLLTSGQLVRVLTPILCRRRWLTSACSCRAARAGFVLGISSESTLY